MKFEEMADEELAEQNLVFMRQKAAVRAQQMALAAELDFRAQRNAFVKAGGDPDQVIRPKPPEPEEE